MAETNRIEKVLSGTLQTIIAGGIIWMAAEINTLDTKVAAIQEKIKASEDIHPAINNLQLSQEEIKERLIRAEDNQHRFDKPKN